ncbi:OmpP1/FadL family transporter [Desulfobacula toluolica]|uniref:Membrane protein, predicted to be involved in aromatic hydrocarbon degradation n=1 Tax=Desulfobacula toluolica (strain DSM 7467 / Tol2) TaxID=651182 RepID=K0NB92_DESTT|nr:outer membrane protein transport protein [Desulfobacula toluolica]CCK81534.1 membrane protein, predicted to be involved in aromatic hydrocarbon degradation [Desulfobacula toluolica Tol2]
MKKPGMMIVIWMVFLMESSVLWAGGADNKTNWSAEYIGILNRNAATDSADIVMYNPAGIMKMENGFYGNVSAHYVAKNYNNKINGHDFDQDKSSIVPGIFTIYKKDKWAGFFGVSNVVGGGKVNFENGNATTNFVRMVLSGGLAPYIDENLKAEAIGLGYTIGGAYSFNDMWSVSLGVRYVKSDRKMKGLVTLPGPFPIDLSFEEEADGFGGIIGINFSPFDALNLGLHYDTKVDLDYEADVKRDFITPAGPLLSSFGVVDGQKRSRNLPAVLAAGVSYKISPKIRAESNLTLYLNNDAGFKDIAGTSRDESAVDNGYDIGIGFEYACTDTLKVTLGYLYTNTGVDAKDMTPELPELDAHTLGSSLGYQMNENLNLIFSLGHVFYKDASFINRFDQPITYEKEITFLAFGIQYKFF